MSLDPTNPGSAATAPTAPVDLLAMTGREVLQAVVDGRLPQAPICTTLSFSLIDVGDGTAAFEGIPGTHLLNPLGMVHGEPRP